MMSRSFILAAASFGAIAAAHAQTEIVEDGEIIVTAQLRAQNPIDVPIALSVMGAEEMERLGIVEFDALSRFVPGFEVQNQSPNNPGFVMRGITSDSGSAFNEPRVSVFQDGVSISKSRGSYVELFDMARVEIAKGPQSTLYGRGALIGAVNLIQNKADLAAVAASGRVSYGNYNAWQAEAMVNAPLNDIFAMRVAGRIRKRDGYVENLAGGKDFNSADTAAIRGALHAEQGAVTLDLIGNYQKDEPAGTAFKSVAFAPADPATGTVLGDTGRNSGAALSPGAGFEGGKPLGLDREVWGVTGIVNVDLGERLTLTSISAFRKFDSLEVFDADGIGLPMLTAAEDAYGEQTSQEFRLTWASDRVTAFLGGSYFHESGFQRTPAQFDERALLARLTGQLSDSTTLGQLSNSTYMGALLQGAAAAYGVALPTAQAQAIAANLKPAHLETSTNSARTRAFDVFGDITISLSEQFELGAGLRYTRDDKRSEYTAAVLNGRSILGGVIGALSQPAPVRDALLGALAVPGAASIPPSALYPVPLFGLGAQPTNGNGAIDSADHDDEGLTWRLTARYMPSHDASIYATYARGRRPEVLSANYPSAPFGASRFNVLDAETVDSYEIGAKTALAGRTLFVDATAFFYQYDNFQTTVQDGTQFIITNAGEAESYGIEAQARWVPSDMMTLFASYGWNNSRFKTGVRDGNRFRLSPDHSASLGAIVGIPAGSGRITFAPSVTWQSKIFFDDDNDRTDLQQPPAALIADSIRDEYQGSYALVNARVGYEGADARWRIEAFVDNAFDEKYIMDAGNTGDGLGMPTFIAGAPRFYGVALSVRLGGR